MLVFNRGSDDKEYKSPPRKLVEFFKKNGSLTIRFKLAMKSV